MFGLQACPLFFGGVPPPSHRMLFNSCFFFPVPWHNLFSANFHGLIATVPFSLNLSFLSSFLHSFYRGSFVAAPPRCRSLDCVRSHAFTCIFVWTLLFLRPSLPVQPSHPNGLQWHDPPKLNWPRPRPTSSYPCTPSPLPFFRPFVTRAPFVAFPPSFFEHPFTEGFMFLSPILPATFD